MRDNVLMVYDSAGSYGKKLAELRLEPQGGTTSNLAYYPNKPTGASTYFFNLGALMPGLRQSKQSLHSIWVGNWLCATVSPACSGCRWAWKSHWTGSIPCADIHILDFIQSISAGIPPTTQFQCIRLGGTDCLCGAVILRVWIYKLNKINVVTL